MRLRSLVQALVLLSVVLELPLAARLVRRFTAEPRVEVTDIDGVTVEVVRPAGSGPWPTWLFVNGAHPLRRAEPVVERLSRGLARAGFLVLVPDVPGLGEGAITARTLDATVAVTAAAVRRPDVRGGRIALIGASTGAGLALVTAGRPELAERITLVAAVAPYADLRRMICLATTRSYAENGRFSRYNVTDLHRSIVARSLVVSIGNDRDRERLLALLDRAQRAGTDPIAALGELDGLTEEGRAVVEILRNDDPGRFAALCDALSPSFRALLDDLSPLRGCSGVRAPVELVVPPSDMYFPAGEATALAAAVPTSRLTITSTLDHTRPQLSAGRARDVRAFLGFVVRGLEQSARTS